MSQVDLGSDYRFDRAEAAKKLAAIADERGKPAQAVRLRALALLFWQAANADFNMNYSMWCD